MKNSSRTIKENHSSYRIQFGMANQSCKCYHLIMREKFYIRISCGRKWERNYRRGRRAAAHVQRADGSPGAVAELGDVGRYGRGQQLSAQPHLRLVREGPRYLPVRQRRHARRSGLPHRRGRRADGARRFAPRKRSLAVTGEPDRAGAEAGQCRERCQGGRGDRWWRAEVVLWPEHGARAVDAWTRANRQDGEVRS